MTGSVTWHLGLLYVFFRVCTWPCCLAGDGAIFWHPLQDTSWLMVTQHVPRAKMAVGQTKYPKWNPGEWKQRLAPVVPLVLTQAQMEITWVAPKVSSSWALNLDSIGPRQWNSPGGCHRRPGVSEVILG